MERNPYAPTKESLNAGSLDGQGDSTDDIASHWRRLANLLLDMMAYFVLFILIEICNGIINKSFGVDLIGLAGPLATFGILIAYYFLSEAFLGRTVGKFVTRTRVVGESGQPAQRWIIFLRTLYRFVPFDAISFLGRRGYGWHDRWSKTRVVVVRR